MKTTMRIATVGIIACACVGLLGGNVAMAEEIDMETVRQEGCSTNPAAPTVLYSGLLYGSLKRLDVGWFGTSATGNVYITTSTNSPEGLYHVIYTNAAVTGNVTPIVPKVRCQYADGGGNTSSNVLEDVVLYGDRLKIVVSANTTTNTLCVRVVTCK